MKRFENYSYELTPHPAELGGGWLLRLLADGRELGQRVFVPAAGIEDDALAASAAHNDASARASAWLVSIASRPISQRPRPADSGGMYLLMPDDELLWRERAAVKPEPIVVEWLQATRLE